MTHEGFQYLEHEIDDETARLLSQFKCEKVGDDAYDLLDCNRTRKGIAVDLCRYMRSVPGILGIDMLGNDRVRLYMDEQRRNRSETITD
jgi:hypothetical protein